MNCTEAQERIGHSLDDAAPLTGDLRDHLDACAECTRYLDEMTTLGARLSEEARSIVAEIASPKVDEVVAALDGRPAPKARSRRRIFVAVACAAGLLLALGALRRSHKGAGTAPAPKQIAAPTFSKEQREALRVLQRARSDLLAELTRPARTGAHKNAEYGQQLVDLPLGREISGIESSVRSAEAFLLECLPIPVVAPSEGSGNSRDGLRPVAESAPADRPRAHRS